LSAAPPAGNCAAPSVAGFSPSIITAKFIARNAVTSAIQHKVHRDITAELRHGILSFCPSPNMVADKTASNHYLTQMNMHNLLTMGNQLMPNPFELSAVYSVA
jgi:hypothetical protein